MAQTDKTYEVGEDKWIYPHIKKPPTGKKLALLTIGGIQTTGEWKYGGGFKAWQLLFRTDKQMEEMCGIFLSLEDIVEQPIKQFHVPEKLPAYPTNWTRTLSARWVDTEDAGVEVAAIYKMVDGERFNTPILYQYDHRVPQVFQTGYAILNTGKVFTYWSDLVAYWPEYLRILQEEGSEAVACHCATKEGNQND